MMLDSVRVSTYGIWMHPVLCLHDLAFDSSIEGSAGPFIYIRYHQIKAAQSHPRRPSPAG